MQDSIFNTNPAQSAEPVQPAATEQPVIAGAPAPVASPAPGVPTQKKSKKGLIIGLIAAAVVVIALVVVFVVIKPFDKKISASTETEEDPNFSSVEKVIKAFVKNIKDEKYDKALSYVYGYGDEKANLKVTDISDFSCVFEGYQGR